MKSETTNCRAINGQRPRRTGASSGFTLIEVLVALAILVVGIFALIELFPPGFFSLQVAANETAANNLGRAELEQLAANNINQLEGVYALYTDPAGVMSYNPLDLPDPHLRDTSLNTSSDIDAERAIQGELVRISPAVNVYPYTGTTRGNTAALLSIYVPNFAPIQMTPSFAGYQINEQNGQLANTTQAQLNNDNFVLKVGGLPWTRIVGSSSGTIPGAPGNANPNYSDPNAQPTGGQPQYLIDYSAMKIAIGPEFDQTATPGPGAPWYVQPFNFTVTGTDGHLYSAQFVWDPNITTYYVPGTGAGAGCQWFTITSWTDLTNGTSDTPPGWVTGTDKLWRDFHLVYNANVQKKDLPSYLVGNNQTFSAAFGADPYSYAIAYQNLDNGNTSDMGVLAFNPSAAQIRDSKGNPLMASINYSAADWHIIHEDHTLGSNGGQAPIARLFLKNIYQLGTALPDNSIYPGLVPNMVQPLDIDVVDLDTGQSIAEDPNLSPSSPDYNNGVLTFSTVNDPTIAGAHVRVLYKADGDWGLALIKAPAVYTLAQNGQSPSNTVGTYQINGMNLSFPPTDVGKQVRITSVTLNTSNGQQANVIDGNLYVIQPGATAISPGTVALSYSSVPTETGIASIQSVQGVSVTARVIWKDRSNWRNRDITTLTAGVQ